jgi:hypothetical protein
MRDDKENRNDATSSQDISLIHKGGHIGKFGVSSASPWREVKSGPRIKKKKIHFMIEIAFFQ